MSDGGPLFGPEPREPQANPWVTAAAEAEPQPVREPEASRELGGADASPAAELRDGVGLGDALRAPRRTRARKGNGTAAGSSPAPPTAPRVSRPAVAAQAVTAPASPTEGDVFGSVDEVYRVSNGREVRDTPWSRFVQSAVQALTNSAGKREGELDERGEAQRLCGLSEPVTLACASTKGGAGKSLHAHVLAESWAMTLRMPVLVLEADLEWGTAASAAPAVARRRGTLIDVFNAREQIHSAVQLAPFLVNLRGGAQLLPGPSDPELIEQLGPEQVGEVLRLVRRFYPIVVLDLPPGVGLANGNPMARWGIGEASEILAIATPRKAHIEQAQRMLWFLSEKHPDTPVTFVLNAVPVRRDAATDRIVKLARTASRERFAVVPYDRALDRQIDAGTFELDSLAQPTRIAFKELARELAERWCR